MNQMQIDFLKSKTCYILDCNMDTEKQLQDFSIPKSQIKKITKAFDLIFEVNEFACQAEEKKKATDLKRKQTNLSK